MQSLSGFSDSKILQVWEKGKIVKDYPPDIYRKDVCGAWMCFKDYGNKNVDFGWEIDHIIPTSKGGHKTDINNLQPMQWQNNRSKADNYPAFTSIVTAEGNGNIESEKTWEYKKQK